MLIPSHLRGAILIEKLKLDFIRSINDKLEEMPMKRIEQLEEKLVQKVDGLDERLRSVQSILNRLEMKMGHLLSLHPELQSTMSDFVSKVDRIIKYSHSLQQARMLKRPLVKNDVGMFYRMSAPLHFGTSIRLQLMYQSVTGFQRSRRFEDTPRSGEKLVNSGAIEISYKVMYYVVKAGLDSIISLDQAIPEWEDLKSDIVQLDGISDDDHRALLKGGESKELREAWLRIQQTLAPQLQNSYS
ncbi:hypothetical protein AXG93_2175s1730 [Marchantia polymorpha subsp. ruderalis]|uniref:Uncharacterized protein n=1 Tax=Marchantia polymorpha subsp. ruderalis TaxID=1480154 RepID=A0A176W6D3_MARPO|nr:hypothetical protein AXG93_2175s1730 [Marchantia polymorpha subsp. ruderalis]